MKKFLIVLGVVIFLAGMPQKVSPLIGTKLCLSEDEMKLHMKYVKKQTLLLELHRRRPGNQHGNVSMYIYISEAKQSWTILEKIFIFDPFMKKNRFREICVKSTGKFFRIAEYFKKEIQKKPISPRRKEL